MPWFPFRRQVAVNQAGQLVPAGSFQFTDVGGSPRETRTFTYNAEGEIEPGDVINPIMVSEYASAEFAAEVPEGYAKSGSLPAIYLFSAVGMRDATEAAAARVESVQQAFSEALAVINTDLGQRMRYRGAWAANRSYAVNDVFVVGSGATRVTYLVTAAFTSGTSAPTAAGASFFALGAPAGAGTGTGSTIPAENQPYFFYPTTMDATRPDVPGPVYWVWSGETVPVNMAARDFVTRSAAV